MMTLESEIQSDDYWPVYKGESFDLWNPDTGVYYAWAEHKKVCKWLLEKRWRARKNRRSAHHEFPKEHLGNQSTLPCHRPRIAFRGTTNCTNRRTIIACLIPPKVFITNSAPYFLWPHGDERDQAFLLGVLCSIPLDWYARRFVEKGVNFFIINPFPIPRPDRDDSRWKQVVSLAGHLACPDDRFADWANAVDVSCGPLAETEKHDMIHKLDAVVAHLYGLEEKQLVHIFKTFHEGWNYEQRLTNVLGHFRDIGA